MASALWSPLADAHHADARYAVDTRQAVQRWWPKCGPSCDWRWFYAQLMQESSLNPEAVSPVGAAGLAQFMPATWSHAKRKGWVPATATRTDARWSIIGGARYMHDRRNVWGAEGRAEVDRWALARASYNAGTGRLLAAQRACSGVREYARIIACLPQITGRHARETIDYEVRIRQRRARL